MSTGIEQSTSRPLRHPRLYAHWLDGEWQKIASPIAVEREYLTLQNVIEGWLKLHALFGTRIVLSDVQLTDSPLTLRLFAQPEFRDYLRHDLSFLILVAQARQGFQGDNERLGRATRGLARAHQNGWRTSLPSLSVDEIKAFSEPVLSATVADTRKWLRDKSAGPGKVIASLPQHRELLEGLLHAICHFTKTSGGPSEAPVERVFRSYADFLIEVKESKALPPQERTAIHAVWNSITKSWVPDEERWPYRSSLLEAMELKQPDRSQWPPDWHRVWNTVVHAWNENVSYGIGSDRSSIAELPEAIVPFRGVISDVVTPTPGGLLKARTPTKFPIFAFDPSELSWTQIRNAVQDTRPLRNQFQTALASRQPEAIRDAGATLVRSLTHILAPATKTVIPKRIWVPLSVLAFLAGWGPVEAAIGADHLQAWLKSEFSRVRVLNTLHGFKDEVTSAFISGARV